ncbi:DHHA1 domain-containing protein [Halobacillus yeomjeoni]|uniref:alanyl-tRNA editing protein n=1 Tax=Halobacillus yeomjeoni TaxID=311194 RepID=UPI001CD797EA|nr:DHHA1 domain-containing protein [Halobacillus yeomjeoni]MCA0984424.1 DHHA1 domain-containing protein [Halobacillus yeomjeoni]
MTQKLYYEDPYKMTFETTLVKTDQDARGHYIVLEETAFYPTGGGQPHDTGVLNGMQVVDVEEVEGEIRHYVSGKLPADTEKWSGEVDRERRFDHMQQHTGQHIISAVFDDRFGIPTTSFHLGKETVTIDLDTDYLSNDLLEKAEQQVNEIILENLPVETKWMSVEEAGAYPLRKQLAVEDDVRLVIIPDTDYNGCGGTHPHSTGEVMAVKFLGWTKSKGQVRLEFACGHRVRQKLGEKHQVLTEMKQLISRPEEQLVEEVSAIIQSSKEKDKEIAELEERLLQYEALEIISEIPEDGVVHRVFNNRSIKSLQSLGKTIIEEAPDVYLILVSEQEHQLQFVLAHGENIERNMNEIAKQTMPLIEGKGGGKPHFVQGGGRNLLNGADFAQKVKELL